MKESVFIGNNEVYIEEEKTQNRVDHLHLLLSSSVQSSCLWAFVLDLDQ